MNKTADITVARLFPEFPAMQIIITYYTVAVAKKRKIIQTQVQWKVDNLKELGSVVSVRTVLYCNSTVQYKKT